MSRERAFEMTAEVRELLEEQEALLGSGVEFVNLSVQQLGQYAKRHARIGQLSKELQTMSYALSYTSGQKSENTN
jgi:hypothetical protein